jgi:hypothetical protein
MNLSDLLRLLPQAGDPEAAAYLNDPNSRPEIGRTRPPMFPPPPQATLAPDGMRLPLPRIEGTGAINRMQKAPAYPMAFGPGAGAMPPQQPQGRPQLQFPARAPTMRFRDATATVGPEMIQDTPPADNEPWRQPAPTPMYQGGGIYAGLANDGLPQGAPALRRGVEPPSGYEPLPSAMSEDEEWNAAQRRVRETLNFERLNSESRKTPALPRQGAPLLAQGFSRRAR